MKDLENNDNDIDMRTNVLRWSLTAAAFVALAFSFYGVFSYGVAKTATLAVAVLVACLVAQHKFRVPRTDSVFYLKTVVAFWGTVFLGFSGGVILAAAAAGAEHGSPRRKPWASLSAVSRDTVAAAVSAAAYAVALYIFSSPYSTVIAGGFSIPSEVVFASCMMAAAHYAALTAIDLISLLTEGQQVDRGVLDRVAVAPATGHLVALATAICLFLTFQHFGIELGLVLVPGAIGANVAYRVHVRSLESKTREIMEASRIHLATVEALATAIDARDQLGVGHVRRIQIYAVGMGRLLELSDGEIDALRTGALLHDIGKLAVPDHILNKPGSLSHAEMEKVKTHSSVGASILEKVGFPVPVVPTVKYHHEFWDGSGYPEGLRGAHIPLTARILAVADSYDTLRGERPYRSAVSREEACNFLRAGAGSQFDPKIVELFLRNLKHFEEEIAQAGLAYDDDAALQTGPSFVEQIKRANREVYTLYSLAREFSSSMSLDDTLSLFSEKIGEFVPYDCCAVYLLEDAGEFANAVHVRGAGSEAIAGNRVRVGEGATGNALKDKKPVENADPSLDLADTEGAPEFITMVSRPLMADDRVVGAVTLYSATLAAYQPDHFRLLETVSKIAADPIEKSRRHAEAATHALTDPITQLPNARRLQAEFEKEVKRATRTGSTFQVLMLDLDGFKAVNDTFGHKVGDKLLVALGGVIRKELREYDFLARYAGDEFVALIPDTDTDEVGELCRRIEAAVMGFGLPVDRESVARVGVSIGSACYPAQGESLDQLVISADKAMYLTKALHKQKSKAYDEITKPPDLGEEYRSEPPRAVDEDDAIHISMVPEVLPSGEHFVVEVDEEQIVDAAWRASKF